MHILYPIPYQTLPTLPYPTLHASKFGSAVCTLLHSAAAEIWVSLYVSCVVQSRLFSQHTCHPSINDRQDAIHVIISYLSETLFHTTSEIAMHQCLANCSCQQERSFNHTASLSLYTLTAVCWTEMAPGEDYGHVQTMLIDIEMTAKVGPMDRPEREKMSREGARMFRSPRTNTSQFLGRNYSLSDQILPARV